MSPVTRTPRADEIFRSDLDDVHKKTDRMFLWLLLGQWLFSIGIALLVSPFGWAGKVRTIHFHVQIACLLGAAINALPIALILKRPGSAWTRHVVAASQMLWSALLIHLTGGRIETHFHVFGSLAFVAFYRDWRVLLTATVVVAGDHLARGLAWPESVYGIANPEWWRFLEHASWVVFEDIVLVFGCFRGTAEMRTMASREAALETVNVTIEHEVEIKTAELKSGMERYKTLVESSNAVPWEMDGRTLTLTYCSPRATELFGYDVETLLNSPAIWDQIVIEDRDRVRAQFEKLATSEDGTDVDLDYRGIAAEGRHVFVRSIARVHREGTRVLLRGIMFDITAQKKLEIELRQAQKLESVGRLAAGVAHEINTPIQFVNDSIHFVRDAMKDLAGLIDKYRALHRSVASGTPDAEAVAEVARAEEEADLPYLLENIPKALDRSLDGAGRVAIIVRSMKEFAHPDQKEMTSVDVNQAIRSTLIIARNEYKYVADVDTELGDLPSVTCHGGDVNQAVLNIVVNAAHAIDDRNKGTEEKGRITVRTRRDGDDVVISIADTGGGIPEAIRDRIFDPFFTTKEVGRGTGQGLAIARSVILEKHGGDLTFETETGKGTTFFIRLPIDGGRAALGVAA